MLYLSQKWSDCHETKSKHSDWTLGLKCDKRVWPWPWPWPWIFKVKYRICYISAKNGPIATKRKANIAIELWGSNVTSGFDLGHDLDLEFSRSNIEFAISQPKMVRLPRNEKQTYWLNSRPQMWPMVWIYQIVTGVTSVVGVPSTHLVFNLVLLIGIFRSSDYNALWWMPQDLIDDKSTLVQVMACCCQATSHYLSQCWPRSMMSYGVNRPQWVEVGIIFDYSMMTSWHGKSFCNTGPFVRETTSHWWIPLTKGKEKCGSLIFSSMLTEQVVEQEIKLLVIGVAMLPTW